MDCKPTAFRRVKSGDIETDNDIKTDNDINTDNDIETDNVNMLEKRWLPLREAVETSKLSKMKKKIALLLAFAMLLSILPMNVVAGDAPGGQISGLATGALWERTLGRATNLRHWAPGVLVAHPDNMSIFKNAGLKPNSPQALGNAGSFNTNGDAGKEIAADAGSNLRSILANYDYFRERSEYAATVQMRIHNTRGFMASLFNARTLNFLNWGYGGSGTTASRESVEGFLQTMTSASWDSVVDISSTTRDAVVATVLYDAGVGFSRATSSGLSTSMYNYSVAWPGSTMDVSAWLNKSANDLDTKSKQAASAKNAYTTISNTILAAVRTATGTNDLTLAQANTIAEALAVFALWKNPSSTVTTPVDIATVANAIDAANIDMRRVTVSTSTTIDDEENVYRLLEDIVNVYVPSFSTDIMGWIYGSTAISPSYLRPWLASNDFVRMMADAGYFSTLSDTLSKRIANFRREINNVIRQDVAVGSDGILTNRPRVPIMFLEPTYPASWTPSVDFQGRFLVAVFPRYNGAGIYTASNGVANWDVLPFNNQIIANEVDLVLFRTVSDRSVFGTNSAVPQVAVPIEFITNGDSNDESVYLTFNTRAGWPAAGEAGTRTYLTSNSDSRFTVGLYSGSDTSAATPKTFHRYGRAVVPGIRISEAVQSAFDQKDWWIELKIDSPGFYWTQDSVGTSINSFQGNFQTRFQTSNSSAQQTGANDIRPVRQLHSLISRTPATGNNQFTTIAFPVELVGVRDNLNRQINDWLQVNNLSIGATDRARIGDVVVDVNLYRANQGTSNDVGHWTWHPWPLQETTINGTTYVVGQWGRAAFGDNGPDIRYWPSETPSSTGSSPVVWYTDAARNRTQTSSAYGQANQTVGEYRWNRTPQGTTGFAPNGDAVFEGEVVVARYANIGLELFVHEKDNLEDFDLRSGIRDWPYITTPEPGEIRPIGAIDVKQINDAKNDLIGHRTARVVLRELAPGSLPATGAHPTVYSFNDGVQILGARIWSNDAKFISDHNDSDQEVWFGNQAREADNFLNASLDRNQLSIRPEIGREARRDSLAEITVEFYLSVQAGYESMYGTDIELTVSSGTVEEPFEGKLVIAHAWDPISVQTQNIVLDENNIEAVIGMVRAIDVSDITITETRSGQLVVGDRIWVGLEGGISRGWGSADHVQLNAQTVETTGNLQVSPIQRDSHGFFVEISRTASSADEDGQMIKFGGVQVSGRVVPNQQYNLIVADSGVAKNWEGFSWINTQQQDVGFARGIVRGFFNEEPYITPAFSFEGSDVIFTPPSTVPGGGGGGTGIDRPIGTLPAFTARTIRESDPTYTTSYGQTLTAPLIQFVSTANNYVTAYVMFSVVADVLGVEPDWDPATGVATFDNGLGTKVSLTNGSRQATLTTPTGGTREVPITASGISVDARILNDRFYVPIKFFDEVVPEFGIKVEWLENQPTGSRGVLIAPR